MAAIDVVMVGLVSLLAGILALVAVSFLPVPRDRRDSRDRATAPLEFVFDGGEIVQTCSAGQHLLRVTAGSGDALGRLTALLSSQLPDLAKCLAELAPGATASLEGTAPPHPRLMVRRVGAALHLRLEPAPGTDRATLVAGLMAAAAARMQDVLEAAPLPVWLTDGSDRVVWANTACLAAAPAGAETVGAADGTAAVAPFVAAGPARGPTRRRVALPASDGGPPRWFDCLHRPLPDGGSAGFALPADDLVRAETTLRGFLQTLSRSFAHLPIGLAIFDAEGRLNLFNPVLSDLTGLPPDFLARRPTLHAVLDRLRELRMIPEPRDYAAWRRRIADIERAADSGHYTELWPLPSGQTFRVTGQPDAEGGVALLFENVTSETARNRALKQRGDLLAAALSALDRAVAVFDGSGTAVVQTEAYLRLWGVAALQDAGFAAALDRWAEQCRPTPLWQELRAAADDPAGRGPRQETLILRDGRVLGARFLPLPGRGLMVDFAARATRPQAQARPGSASGPGKADA